MGMRSEVLPIRESEMTNENDPAMPHVKVECLSDGTMQTETKPGLTALEHTCLTTLTLDDRLPSYMYDAILARLRWETAKAVFAHSTSIGVDRLYYAAPAAVVTQADALIAELVKPQPEVK